MIININVTLVENYLGYLDDYACPTLVIYFSSQDFSHLFATGNVVLVGMENCEEKDMIEDKSSITMAHGNGRRFLIKLTLKFIIITIF